VPVLFAERRPNVAGTRRTRAALGEGLWTGDDERPADCDSVRAVSDPLRAAGLLVSAADRADASPLGTAALIRAESRGQLRRLRRGAYVGADHWESLDATARNVLAVRAALVDQPGALVSHWSAAAVLGLPIVGRRDDAVHLTVPVSSGGRSTIPVRRHQVAGHVGEEVVDGIRVTSAARTVLDLARVGGLVPSVAAGDAALRAGLVTPGQLGDELAAIGTARGIRLARRAVSLLDARSESPGESLSRVRMVELGLPHPQLQHEVRDGGGFVARVDFFWPELGVVGEFDGKAKYGLDDPRRAGDRLWQEKLREDRIRATGLVVVRWIWDDAWRGEPMARLLRAAGVR